MSSPDPIFGAPSFLTTVELTGGFIPLKTTGSRGGLLTYNPSPGGGQPNVYSALPSGSNGAPSAYQLWKLDTGANHLINQGATNDAGGKPQWLGVDVSTIDRLNWQVNDRDQRDTYKTHVEYDQGVGQFTLDRGEYNRQIAMNQPSGQEASSIPYFIQTACPGKPGAMSCSTTSLCTTDKPWWWGPSNGGDINNCNRNGLWVSDKATGLPCCGTIQGPEDSELCEYCAPDYTPILKSGNTPSGFCQGNPASSCPGLMIDYCESNNYPDNCMTWLAAENYKTLKRQVAQQMISNYAKKHGFNPDDDFWSKKAPQICMSAPGVCDDVLDSMCSKYTRADMGKNPSLQALCGCHLPDTRENTQYIYSNEIPRACDPICNISQPGYTTIPRAQCSVKDPEDCTFIECTDTTCVIDDVVIDMVNSSFGNMTFAQACSQCNKKGSCSDGTCDGNGSDKKSCSCYLSDIDAYIKNSKIGNIDLEKGCGPCFSIGKDGKITPSGLCSGKGPGPSPTPSPAPRGGGFNVWLLFGSLGGVALLCLIVIIIIVIVSLVHRSHRVKIAPTVPLSNF